MSISITHTLNAASNGDSHSLERGTNEDEYIYTRLYSYLNLMKIVNKRKFFIHTQLVDKVIM